MVFRSRYNIAWPGVVVDYLGTAKIIYFALSVGVGGGGFFF